MGSVNLIERIVWKIQNNELIAYKYQDKILGLTREWASEVKGANRAITGIVCGERALVSNEAGTLIQKGLKTCTHCRGQE